MLSIHARLGSLADPTRTRLLALLERNELTVSELCSVTQLPQSTVSRHLKVLVDDGWAVSSAEGTSRRYRAPLDRLDAAGRRLWGIVREQIAEVPATRQDRERLRSVLAARRTASQEFFSTAAGQWDRLRLDLFGNRTDLVGLLALLDHRWVVGDLGCGTGQVAELLAPFVARVVAVDESSAMLGAARKRLRGIPNAEVRDGDLAALPIEDESLDVALLFLVLHYAADPVEVLREVRRTLKPDGRLLVVDMMPHDLEEMRERMGHVWPGFSEDDVARWALDAGLGAMRYTPLPADAQAKGPTLFAATAHRNAAASRANSDTTDARRAGASRTTVADGSATHDARPPRRAAAGRRSPE